jgi:hypothetical protein
MDGDPVTIAHIGVFPVEEAAWIAVASGSALLAVGRLRLRSLRRRALDRLTGSAPVTRR